MKCYLRNAATNQMVRRTKCWIEIVVIVFLLSRSLPNADIEMASDASLRGQQFTKQERKSEGTAWRDNGKPGGVLHRRTKRDKVNSEAHLAVLPSNLATRQCEKT